MKGKKEKVEKRDAKKPEHKKSSFSLCSCFIYLLFIGVGAAVWFYYESIMENIEEFTRIQDFT